LYSGTLSGGQKSRVSFAVITNSNPHLLVLDEPSNHLDLETLDALAESINEFKGGVIFVSHDQHFLTSCCKEMYVVSNGKVNKLIGTFDDYKKEVLRGLKK
jgi:ATP-binding cassette subfamily F protein 3